MHISYAMQTRVKANVQVNALENVINFNLYKNRSVVAYVSGTLQSRVASIARG